MMLNHFFYLHLLVIILFADGRLFHNLAAILNMEFYERLSLK